MVRITGLPVERFEQFYWADRHAYDEGKLTGATFWQKLARDAGLSLTPTQIRELNELDARMWTTCNPLMLAWHQRLKEVGVRTAILSNMGDSVLANIEREFKWIHDFDVLVWSYQLGIAKPDPDIYRHTLDRLQSAPEETLFIDDKYENIQAAWALGMKAIQFSSLDQLRSSLLESGLDRELPLP